MLTYLIFSLSRNCFNVFTGITGLLSIPNDTLIHLRSGSSRVPRFPRITHLSSTASATEDHASTDHVAEHGVAELGFKPGALGRHDARPASATDMRSSMLVG